MPNTYIYHNNKKASLDSLLSSLQSNKAVSKPLATKKTQTNNVNSESQGSSDGAG